MYTFVLTTRPHNRSHWRVTRKVEVTYFEEERNRRLTSKSTWIQQAEIILYHLLVYTWRCFINVYSVYCSFPSSTCARCTVHFSRDSGEKPWIKPWLLSTMTLLILLNLFLMSLVCSKIEQNKLKHSRGVIARESRIYRSVALTVISRNCNFAKVLKQKKLRLK